MTDLEKYIKEHKTRMDIGYINPDMWSGIEKKLPIPRSKRKRYLYPKIASAAAIILITLGIFLLKGDESMEIPEDLFATYGFTTPNVQEVFDTKITFIEKTAIPVSFRSDLQNLLSQVEYLDQTYNNEIAYLEQFEYEEKIAIQVLQYYKTKNELLDKIIQVIENINRDENIYTENNRPTYINL